MILFKRGLVIIAPLTPNDFNFIMILFKLEVIETANLGAGTFQFHYDLI